jgi:hypothetical protein
MLRREKGQALVELAIVMPILVGIIAVLFQFGILFITYLSLVHETRDIGRYVAVHPDTLDGACVTANTLWKQVCDDAPSVVDRTKVIPSFSIACAAFTSGRCAGRTVGVAITTTLTYDASSSVFLPTNFRLGPWLQVKIPGSQMTYDYTVMVEPH